MSTTDQTTVEPTTPGNPLTLHLTIMADSTIKMNPSTFVSPLKMVLSSISPITITNPTSPQHLVLLLTIRVDAMVDLTPILSLTTMVGPMMDLISIPTPTPIVGPKVDLIPPILSSTTMVGPMVDFIPILSPITMVGPKMDIIPIVSPTTTTDNPKMDIITLMEGPIEVVRLHPISLLRHLAKRVLPTRGNPMNPIIKPTTMAGFTLPNSNTTKSNLILERAPPTSPLRGPPRREDLTPVAAIMQAPKPPITMVSVLPTESTGPAKNILTESNFAPKSVPTVAIQVSTNSL